MLDKRDIKSLVVRYEAFMSAADHASKCLWAHSLREIQNKIGIVMLSPEALDYYADQFPACSRIAEETGIAL